MENMNTPNYNKYIDVIKFNKIRKDTGMPPFNSEQQHRNDKLQKTDYKLALNKDINFDKYELSYITKYYIAGRIETPIRKNNRYEDCDIDVAATNKQIGLLHGYTVTKDHSIVLCEKQNRLKKS